MWPMAAGVQGAPEDPLKEAKMREDQFFDAKEEAAFQEADWPEEGLEVGSGPVEGLMVYEKRFPVKKEVS